MRRIGRIHLITDDRPGREVLAVTAAALAGGVDTVQVRVAEEVTDREAYELAGRILALCRRYAATCLVNDRLDVALAVGADGGHVGAEDLPVAAARRVLGRHAILGVTARDPGTALRAVADGADYLGVGPAYATDTKPGLPTPIGVAGVAGVANAVDLPVIAIGGVTADRVAGLCAAGAHGVAVVGAINAAPDASAAAAGLRRAVDAAGTIRRKATRMKIMFNGTGRSVGAPATVQSVITALVAAGPGGLAAAVNGAVVPRSEWASRQVRDGDTVEVLTAVQGG